MVSGIFFDPAPPVQACLAKQPIIALSGWSWGGAIWNSWLRCARKNALLVHVSAYFLCCKTSKHPQAAMVGNRDVQSDFEKFDMK